MWVSIIERSPNGIFITNKIGKYLYSNPAFTKITGYPKEDTPTLKTWFYKAFPDPVYRESVEEILNGVEQGFKETACLLKNVCKDGRINEVEFSSFNLKGEIRGIMLRDIQCYTSSFKALNYIFHDLENYRDLFHSVLMPVTSRIKEQPLRISTLNHYYNNKSDLSEESLSLRNTETDPDASKKMALTIQSRIMPILKDLQKEKTQTSDRFCEDLDLLKSYLSSLTRCLTEGDFIASCLSYTEMQVATMIKNGMSSAQIADKLNISIDTVKTHRRNIRKKLNIQKSNVNLRTFLTSRIS